MKKFLMPLCGFLAFGQSMALTKKSSYPQAQPVTYTQNKDIQDLDRIEQAMQETQSATLEEKNEIQSLTRQLKACIMDHDCDPQNRQALVNAINILWQQIMYNVLYGIAKMGQYATGELR